MIYVILIFLGLCLGSFVNALVWRVHQQITDKKNKKLSIMLGRSMCPDCKHNLTASDLVPVLSWLALKGKCRYCRQPISVQYPLVELTMAIVFIVSYAFWPLALHNGQWVLFITWIICSVGLLALLIYDLKWMLLPSRIIYTALGLAVVGQTVYLIGFEAHKVHALINWLTSIAVASGVFYIIFMVSEGKWIGYGDVRLGLLTGTLLQSPIKSMLMLFLASVLGIAAIIPLIGFGKRILSQKIPYGPFLITATSIVLLWGDRFINWYKYILGP